MSDVVPRGVTADSAFLFHRMTELSFELLGVRPGARILDVAAGFGQDTAALRARGAGVVALEASARMTGAARWRAEREGEGIADWVRGWSHALPFADASFDGVLCKGSLDHFERPLTSLGEMARVVRPAGVVVVAIANFHSLACRWGARWDDLRARWVGHDAGARRAYDVPSDHFTRYDVELLRAQLGRWLELDRCVGASLGWGAPGWSNWVNRSPAPVASRLLAGLDAWARSRPGMADVVIASGRRRAPSTTR